MLLRWIFNLLEVKQIMSINQGDWPLKRNNSISNFSKWPKMTFLHGDGTKPSSSHRNYDPSLSGDSEGRKLRPLCADGEGQGGWMSHLNA